MSSFSSSSCSCPMDAIEAKNRDKGAEKKQSRSLSSWRTMALMKNRGQRPGGEGESRSSSSSSREKKKMGKSISIGMSMACGGSICSTKESSVLSRESRRSTSSRSLKAPGNGALVAVTAAAGVSASSSFNSETTVATTTTTTTTATSVDSLSSTLSSSGLSSPLSSVGVSRSFRKLSGCYYECHSGVDPRTSLGGGATMLSCADCDEFFTMAESLELHRATKHAVSEVGADDTSRNVVEIIFRSSWLTQKLQAPVCTIERILKVQSSGKAVERFEQYRERVKARAASGSSDDGPRCAADGNELLRFHCTTFRCSLGLAGATSLCRTTSPHRCKLCGIIRDGFRADGDGRIATTATSGRAHDTAMMSLPADGGDGGEKKAMLVCRVVAGRVKKVVNGSSSSSADHCGSDSVSHCSDLDELFVFNPRAILPCFVVIYSEN